MKKTLSLMAALSLALTAMTGCGGAAAPTSSSAAPAGSSAPAASQAAPVAGDYPKNPVQIVIPYAPGGGSDILTRAIMQYAEFPQPLVAINVEGASGMIGALQAYNAPNDGYSILAHNAMDVASYSLSGASEDELWSDMERICDVVADYNVISTNKQSGWTSIEQVVEYAKANPGKIKWGCTGSQNVNYATTMEVIDQLGLTGLVTIVPYDGGAASKTALMGNHIQVETNSSADIRSSVQSGDTIPLMVVNDAEIAALPGVPSSVSKNVNVTFGKPRGYYAPKGTPQEVLDMIAASFKAVCEKPEFQATISELGLEVKFVDGATAKARDAEWVADLKPLFEEMASGS